MLRTRIRLVTTPTIIVMADMQMHQRGIEQLGEWLRETDPECLPPGTMNLWPHDGVEHGDSATLVPGITFGQDRCISDNELLVELAGRGCYRSYGAKAGQKTNAAYIANLFGEPGKIPHASVLYHAKMTFFFAGISRRVSHELIRHYVGADRDEEGSPSQESTRFTHHPGHFSVHPRDLNNELEASQFARDMQSAYDNYLEYLERQIKDFGDAHGEPPKGMDRKRIYEAAAQRLPSAACTSFYWTTNPEALQKMFRERRDFAADLEMQRFANKLHDICVAQWPNLFRDSNPVYQDKMRVGSGPG